MSEWGDIISRIFSTGRTQGLSGTAEAVLDPDPASAFYASRLRKHHTDGDLVADPGLLWSTPSYGGRKGGLLAHVASERGESSASFTDVLFVINQQDARRAAAWAGGEPWAEHAGQLVGLSFDRFAQKEEVNLPFPRRPLRYWFVADGSREMLAQSFGLGPGEFVSGLLPNLYIGPSTSSQPVVSIHLNLPGVWEGYREVGRLYSDQLLFTLGRHWLDNFHHPSLREPSIYRLQQFSNGTLVHEISPELQDRFVVRSDKVEGASVLTIAERSGRPIAFLVLAVMEASAVETGPRTTTQASAEFGGRPMLPEVEPRREVGQKTIIPGEMGGRVLTLRERGALLQKVHFSAFMEGYDVYIGSNGQMATLMPNPRAIVQVRGRKVTLLSQSETVKVGGRSLNNGGNMPLQGEMDIEIDGHPFYYRDLSDVVVDGWPYLGELRRPGIGTYLEFGSPFRIGRDRRCKVRLPDEPHNDNISWLPQVDYGTMIRARNGDIPKSRFYTDSIMVASEHLEVDLSNEPVVRSLAKHCYSFIRRGNRVIPLFPREGADGIREAMIEPGDEILVGNCLFQANWPPAEVQKRTTALAPPSFMTTVDLPPAAGLGELGSAPTPIRLDNLAQDSISILHPKVQPKKVETPPPPMALPDIEDPVVSVERAWCEAEAMRPARLVQMGWVVGQELLVGNHRDANAILPELRSSTEQAFLTLDYFRIRTVGGIQVELLQPGEARLMEGGVEVEQSRTPSACRMYVVRRDENFEPAFEMAFSLSSLPTLPNGRGWALLMDLSSKQVATLFSVGVSPNHTRNVRLGMIDLNLHYDGRTLAVSDYLPSLRQSDGSLPTIASGSGQQPLLNFPGDGGTVHLHPGDWLLVGHLLYLLRVGG